MPAPYARVWYSVSRRTSASRRWARALDRHDGPAKEVLVLVVQQQKPALVVAPVAVDQRRAVRGRGHVHLSASERVEGASEGGIVNGSGSERRGAQAAGPDLLQAEARAQGARGRASASEREQAAVFGAYEGMYRSRRREAAGRGPGGAGGGRVWGRRVHALGPDIDAGQRQAVRGRAGAAPYSHAGRGVRAYDRAVQRGDQRLCQGWGLCRGDDRVGARCRGRRDHARRGDL